MNLIKVNCAFCGKEFFRELGRVNEAKKFGWNQYCSKKCQNQAQIRSIEKVCANPHCNKKVFREPAQLKKSKSGRIFCSLSCAAIVNNSSKRKIKICPICGRQFYGTRKYCSKLCCPKPSGLPLGFQRITEKQIINQIKEFYKKNGRIPLKREFYHCKAARLRFGAWNKAIQTAGFTPNPVMFAKRYIAKDGHQCDSFSEKIIDDWLFQQNIQHKRSVPYPGDKSLTADFIIKNSIIEFFGLFGDIREYDKLVKRKKKICQKHKVKLIEIYPKDLYPINKLAIILKRFI